MKRTGMQLKLLLTLKGARNSVILLFKSRCRSRNGKYVGFEKNRKRLTLPILFKEVKEKSAEGKQ
jgi:hypothetical protein